MSEAWVRCENCKGKGHVIDGPFAMIATLSVVLIPLLFFERNNPDGGTREKCEACDGKGYRRLYDDRRVR